MKKRVKFRVILLIGILFIFTVIPQSINASEKLGISSNTIDSFDYKQFNLDDETISQLEALDKYIELTEDGEISFDLGSAEEDNLDPEFLNSIKSLMDIDSNENSNIVTFGFKHPKLNYGNYCGKGSNGGKPIDNLDLACQKHDKCFKGINNKSQANKNCNRNLVKAALPIVQATHPTSKKGAAARIAVSIFSKNM